MWKKLNGKSKTFLPDNDLPIYLSDIKGCAKNSIFGTRTNVYVKQCRGRGGLHLEESACAVGARKYVLARTSCEFSGHPVILDEMDRKDCEMAEVEPVFTCA